MTDLSGKLVTVMGLGHFGGGLGAAKWLALNKAWVLVTDAAPADKLAEPLAELQPYIDSGVVTLRLGGHSEADFTGCDLVVANPAVPHPWDNPFLLAARNASVPVTTEMGLLLARISARGLSHRTIGITGSVGKSTTTAMIAHVLGSLGQRVMLGGNIGGSLLPELDRLDPHAAPPWFVLELSSFMLHHLGEELRWSPKIAVVTNLSANHLDWHGSMDHYRASKQHLIAHQHKGDTAIIGPGLDDWMSLGAGEKIRAGVTPFTGPLMVSGNHNRINAAQAAAAVSAALPGTSADSIAAALATFGGLPHRLQLVCERRGVRFYNDSKSTTPDATLRAVESLEDPARPASARRHIHLIVGGYDKKSDLSSVASLAGELAGLYTIGATGPALATAARAAGAEATKRTLESTTLDAAVHHALERAAPGDAILLSPACASWDQFTNYEARGDRFCELARSIA